MKNDLKGIGKYYSLLVTLRPSMSNFKTSISSWCKILIYVNVYFIIMSNHKAFLNTGSEPVLKHWIRINVVQCWYPSFMLEM